MNPRPVGLLDTASQLREEFDRTFGEAPVEIGEPPIELLAIRAGGDSYLVQLSEIAGLHADLSIVELPTSRPEFLGIAAHRGVVWPVYDLSALLGLGRVVRPRWILVARARSPVGLAFEAFESHFRLPRGDVARLDQKPPGQRHAQSVARVGSVTRPLLDLASLLESLEERLHPVTSRKEP